MARMSGSGGASKKRFFSQWCSFHGLNVIVICLNSPGALASNGFVQHIEVLFAGDLVGLLEPEEAQLTNVNRDGRHLKRIVQTSEVDLLTGRQISHFKRAFLDRPPCINAQPVNRPLELGKAGVLQRAVRFADDQQIGFRYSMMRPIWLSAVVLLFLLARLPLHTR